MVSFRLLGPLEVEFEAGRLPLGSGKQRTLLAVLLLHAGKTVPREELIDALWGDHPPATAGESLAVFVSRLRKQLAEFDADSLLVTHSRGYALEVGADQVDAACFERLLAEARAGPRDEEALASLEQALGLWRGRALADLLDEPFARRESERLEELRLQTLEEKIETMLALDQNDEAIVELQLLVSREPLRERPRGQLMLALYRAGRQTEALEVYRDLRRLLAEELGLEPSDALRILERSILEHDDSLKPRRRRARLPRPRSVIVGRDREVAELSGLLRDGEQRLVTLTGTGGTGKTRLALEAAEAVSSTFEDGVFWVPLVAVGDPQLVPTTIAEAIGAKRDLAEQIGDRRLLLVLDNFEQVVAAAPEVARLLGGCRRIVVLATSREPLHIAGEREFPLSALSEPDAVTLFEQRAEAIRPGFAHSDAVARICRRVDCLPLAVELAAARVKVLEPAELLERLGRRLPLLSGRARDVPEHQRTMRTTIEWSYELLDPDSERLFRRFSVFAGGATLAAAAEVCDATVDQLESLIDKSLINREFARFTMLQTVREYASERLEVSDEADALRARHAAFYRALAEQAEPELEGPEQGMWLDAIEQEHDNVRAALEWSLAGADAELGARLASSLYRYWIGRRHIAEARHWTERALGAIANFAPQPALELLRTASLLALHQGDISAGRDLTNRRFELARQNDDRKAMIGCQTNLGFIATVEGDITGAKRLFEEAVSAAHEAGVRADTPQSHLAHIARLEGDSERADALATDALSFATEFRDFGAIIACRTLRAWIRVEQDRVEDALEDMIESIRIGRELKSTDALRCGAELLIVLLVELGSFERGAVLVARLRTPEDELGDEWDFDAWMEPNELVARSLARIMNELTDDERERARIVGERSDLQKLVDTALREVQEARAVRA